MGFDVTVRNAVVNDLTSIVEIYNSTISSRMATADTDPITPESRRSWFAEHSPQSRPLWVVEDHGKVCAWVSFQSFYGRPAYKHTAELSIYVQADYRGKGLGRFLLDQAIRACPELRIKTLVGFVFAHNMPSLTLMERAGFQRWGFLPSVAELDGIERDLVIVGKRLTV